MWDLSSLTRDQTFVPCSGGSVLLEHQESSFYFSDSLRDSFVFSFMFLSIYLRFISVWSALLKGWVFFVFFVCFCFAFFELIIFCSHVFVRPTCVVGSSILSGQSGPASLSILQVDLRWSRLKPPAECGPCHSPFWRLLPAVLLGASLALLGEHLPSLLSCCPVTHAYSARKED